MNYLPNTVDPLGDSYFCFDLILTEFPAANKQVFSLRVTTTWKRFVYQSRVCRQWRWSQQKRQQAWRNTLISEATSAPMPICKQLSVCHIVYLMIRKCWENKKLCKIILKNTHSLLWTLHQHDHFLKQKIRKEAEVGYSYKNKQVSGQH